MRDKYNVPVLVFTEPNKYVRGDSFIGLSFLPSLIIARKSAQFTLRSLPAQTSWHTTECWLSILSLVISIVYGVGQCVNSDTVMVFLILTRDRYKQVTSWENLCTVFAICLYRSGNITARLAFLIEACAQGESVECCTWSGCNCIIWQT